jgi:hypothetical protein
LPSTRCHSYRSGDHSGNPLAQRLRYGSARSHIFKRKIEPRSFLFDFRKTLSKACVGISGFLLSLQWQAVPDDLWNDLPREKGNRSPRVRSNGPSSKNENRGPRGVRNECSRPGPFMQARLEKKTLIDTLKCADVFRNGRGSGASRTRVLRPGAR